MELQPTHRSRTVPVKEGWEDHVLAESIYKEVNGNQVLLLRGGHTLTLENIYRLQNHGIQEMKILTKIKNK